MVVEGGVTAEQAADVANRVRSGFESMTGKASSEFMLTESDLHLSAVAFSLGVMHAVESLRESGILAQHDAGMVQGSLMHMLLEINKIPLSMYRSWQSQKSGLEDA